MSLPIGYISAQRFLLNKKPTPVYVSTESTTTEIFLEDKTGRVLCDPKLIYLEFKMLFPDVIIGVKIVEESTQKIELHFHIPNHPYVFCFAHAFDKFEVRNILQNAHNFVKGQVYTYYHFEPEIIRIEDLDVQPKENFLYGNQEFFRFLAVKEYGSLIKPLFHFLLSDINEYESVLKQIELAPIHDKSISNNAEDLKLFVSLYDYKKNRNEEIDAKRHFKISISLELYYPITYSKISKQFFEEEAQSEEVDNIFHQIKEQLNERVIGQPAAVERTSLFLSKQTMSDQNQTFLFVGPSGVGKTELAKTIAESLKGNRFTFFSMNTYSQDFSVSRLFGSSSGYAGSLDKPLLAKEFDKFLPILDSETETEKIYTVENVVILFDEFEKAHDQVQKSLLTLLDEFKCEMTYTNENVNVNLLYKFKKSIFICTSNLLQREILLGFESEMPVNEISEMFINLNDERGLVASEVIKRMSIIPFGPISKGKDSYQKLLSIKLKSFLKEQKKELSLIFNTIDIDEKNESLILNYLENKLYGNGTDIRKVKDFFNFKLWRPIPSLDIMSKKNGRQKLILSFDEENNQLTWQVFSFVKKLNSYYIQVIPISI